MQKQWCRKFTLLSQKFHLIRDTERMDWKNPFQYYKMKIDKTNVKVPLTKEELDILISKEMPNERLECIRDVFCFCALTGLAFTDADNLQKRHITTDDSGTTWIHKPREKTSVISRVPLLPYPLKILQKYEHNPELQLKGKLLPIPSNQKWTRISRKSEQYATSIKIWRRIALATLSPHWLSNMACQSTSLPKSSDIQIRIWLGTMQKFQKPILAGKCKE